MFNQSLYYFILIVFIALIVFLSFSKYIKLKEIIPFYLISCIPSIILFIVWDIWFVQLKIWEFNHLTVSGYYLFGLPVEHIILYFISTFFSIQIYTIIYNKIKMIEKLEHLHRWFSFFLFLTSLTLLYWQNHKLYTSICALVLFLISGTHLMVINRRYMSWFYLFLISVIIPIGILQILLSKIPIITYNSNEIIGLKIFNAPIENYIYFTNVLIIQFGLFEFVKRIHLRRQLSHQKQSV